MQNMSFLKVKWGLSMRSTWRLQAFSRALFFHAVIRVHLGRYRVSNSIRKETTSLQPFWSQNNIHAVPPPRVRPRMYSSGQQGETLWCRGRSKAEGEVGKKTGQRSLLGLFSKPLISVPSKGHSKYYCAFIHKVWKMCNILDRKNR